MGLHQPKNILHRKEKHQQNKRQSTYWENIFANISFKGLISKIYKEEFHTKKKAIQFKNGQKT